MVKLLLARVPTSDGATLQETAFPRESKSFSKSSDLTWMNQSVFYTTAVTAIFLVFGSELMLKTTSLSIKSLIDRDLRNQYQTGTFAQIY